MGGAGGSGGIVGSGGVAGAGGAPTPVSCTDQYGDAPAFELCVETGTTCEFYTLFAGTTSCSAFCTQRGGHCSTVYNQGAPATHCTYDTVTTYDCNANYQDMICVCTHGCGGGAPCAPGLTCDGTNCL
jgi:hypothetical protein